MVDELMRLRIRYQQYLRALLADPDAAITETPLPQHTPTASTTRQDADHPHVQRVFFSDVDEVTTRIKPSNTMTGADNSVRNDNDNDFKQSSLFTFVDATSCQRELLHFLVPTLFGQSPNHAFSGETPSVFGGLSPIG